MTTDQLPSPFDSQRFLLAVTHQSGVYRMYDRGGKIIYVGKAKDLKKRLASYFRVNLDSIKTRSLVQQIAHIDVMVTNSETEALILEHNLIKQYQPRYNVLLRDDKSYPWIIITDHQHPRIGVHRGAKTIKGDYFGPYPSGGAVRESLTLLQKIFPVRQCEDVVYANRTRPCLLYQLQRCSGPCVAGLVSDSDYGQQVTLARLFLAGKNRQVITELVQKMEQASGELQFEQAARYRDQIQALRRVTEQQAVSSHDLDDMDVVGAAFEQGKASLYVLFIRHGKILGSRSYFPKVPAETPLDEVVHSFLLQFYLSGLSGREIPHEILLDVTLEDEALIGSALSQVSGHTVRVVSRTRAARARFIELATVNAKSALRSHLAHKSTLDARIVQLETLLALEAPIARMECFDISHTMGERTVASCVVFNREGPLSGEYRRFNIEGITPGDDYGAMEQALTRRFHKTQDLDKVPDLIFIDGGIGQLRRAEAVLARYRDCLGGKIPLLIGVAKGASRKAGLETLVMGGSHKAFHLPADMPALHLIQHIRDESHRFAITGHRARRGKARTTSSLEAIPGVGAKRRQALLKYLGGLQEVKKASVAELAKVPGISPILAQRIYDSLHLPE